jgi:hypothetical protein
MAASEAGARLFRNNRGMFLTLDGQRKTRAGLEAPGASDGIGWVQVIVTPDMVGRPLAVFCAIETKTKSGPVSAEQRNFIEQVLAAGGYAGIARGPDDAVRIIRRLL